MISNVNAWRNENSYLNPGQYITERGGGFNDPMWDSDFSESVFLCVFAFGKIN